MDQQNSSLQRAIAQFEAHIRELQQQQLQPQAEQLEEVPRRPPPPLIRRDLLQRGFPASIDIDKPFSHSVLSALADGQPTHIFVAGPPRSGRSSILARIAQAAHSGGLGWAYISTGTELALLMRRNMRAVESGSEAYLSPPHSDKLLLIVDDADYTIGDWDAWALAIHQRIQAGLYCVLAASQPLIADGEGLFEQPGTRRLLPYAEDFCFIITLEEAQ